MARLTAELIKHLHQTGMSGWEAFECCTDTVSDVLGAAQVIVDNQTWWVGYADIALDLPINVTQALFGGAQISPAELVDLLGIWTTGGADGLTLAEGPLAAPALGLDSSWKQTLKQSVGEVIVDTVVKRLWQQNNPRHYRCRQTIKR